MTNPDGTEYIGKVWPGYTVNFMTMFSSTLKGNADLYSTGLPRLVRK